MKRQVVNPASAPDASEIGSRKCQQELLTVAEVAAVLNCGRSTVWRWAKTGTLPKPVKICGVTRWRRAEIVAIIYPDASSCA